MTIKTSYGLRQSLPVLTFMYLLASSFVPGQSSKTLDSKPVYDLLESVGLSKNSDAILAVWALDDPASCIKYVTNSVKQMSNDSKLANSLASRICSIPRTPLSRVAPGYTQPGGPHRNPSLESQTRGGNDGGGRRAARQKSGASSPLLEFQGTLVRVTSTALSVKLPDGRIINAELGTGSDTMAIDSLRERYIGDVVHIQCLPVPPIYDEIEDQVLFLRLDRIQFIRNPMTEELSAALASRGRMNPRNLLKTPGVSDTDLGLTLSSLNFPQTRSDPQRRTSVIPGDEFIEKSRAAIGNYLRNVPNYIADETADRYQAPSIPPVWTKTDSIRDEVRFDGRRETRLNIFVNDRAWSEPFLMLPGWKWRGGFGASMSLIFDPGRPVRFTTRDRILHNGKSARVYGFSAPKDGLGAWNSEYQEFYPAYEGVVTITEEDGMVVRIETKAKEFPSEFPISAVEEVIIWDWVAAGSGRELLPVKADLLIVHAAQRQAYLVRLQYTNHRHFQSASTISFK